MDLEKYFKPALEMAQLVHIFDEAEGEHKAQIGQQIFNSEFMAHIREVQTITGEEFLRGELPPLSVNTAKKDFFYDPAIPRISETAARHEMHYHRHEYLEMVVVLRGTYVQAINGTLHQHNEGSICLLNPNVIHRDIVPGPEDRVLFLGLSPNYLRDELVHSLKQHTAIASFMEYRNGRGTQQYILFHPPEFELVKELVGQLLEEDTRRLPGHHAVIKGLLTRLLSKLAEGHHYEICYQSDSEIHKDLVAEVLQYMDAHLTNLTRAELAAFFHFNPDYLSRLLQEVTGQSYSTHLREMRLAWVANQLRNTNKSVNAIIRELGFSNKGYFNRLFKERYGALPGEYRSQS